MLDTEPLKPEALPQAGFERPAAFGRLPAFADVRPASDQRASAQHLCGYGKVILLGEHAVVYGSHAIAAPIPLAMRATVQEIPGNPGVILDVDRRGVAQDRAQADPDRQDIPQRSVQLVLAHLGLAGRALRIRISSTVPAAMGLGSSAAFAVAVIRALDQHFGLALDDAQVNMLALRCEELAHGTPSGIDNTVATYGRPVLYQRGEETHRVSRIQPLTFARPLPLAIGLTGRSSSTVEAVAAVRRAWQRESTRYEAIFQRIDDIVLQGVQALHDQDLPRLGALMNACHGHLQALDVSTRELDELVDIACRNGALGAKLTGGGRGGSVVALCPENRDRVADAMCRAGYRALKMDLG